MKKQDVSAVAGVFTRKPLFRALEQRIMFDAAAVDTAAQVGVADVTAEPQTAKDDLLLDQLAELVPPAERDSSRLVVVDQSVANYDQLIVQIPENYSVLVVPAGENGLERLAESLKFYNGLESIHILSHGSNDLFQLGDDQLTSQNVSQYADVLGRIGQALSPNGDILLYGCDLAASEQGQSLLQQISALTRADVAASDDATGASQLGGDWLLEQQAGEVESSTLDLTYEDILSAEPANSLQITIDNTEVNQSLGRNSLVARLGVANAESGQSFAFSLFDEEGPHSNDDFSLDSRGLLRANDASALALGDVTVWIQVTVNQQGEDSYTVQKELTLTVVDTTAPKFRGDSDRTGNSSGFLGRVVPGMANGAAVGITVEMDRQDQGNVTFTLGDDADGRFQIDTDTGVVTIKDGSRFDSAVNASHDIVVIATDLAGNSTEKTYGIQVKTAEGAARDDSGTTTQDRTRTGNVLSNDRDPDGNNNALTVVAVGGSAENVGQAVTGSTGGQFTIDADGSWIYDPNDEMAHIASRAVLETSVEVTVRDSLGLESTSTLTIDVQGTNQKPTNLRLNDTTDLVEYSLDPTNREVGVFTVDDVDRGDIHSYSINRDNSRAFEIVGDTLLIKQGIDLAPGEYSITINARDNNALIQQVFSISVVDNSAPVFAENNDSDPVGNSDNAQGSVADGATGGTAVGITATAVDATEITYSLNDDASGRFVIDADTGEVSVAQSITISFADAPYYDITVTARDAFDNTSEQVYRVTVTDLPPVAVDDSVTIVENTNDPVTGDLLANDQNPAEAHELLQVSGVNGSSDNLGQAIAGDNGGQFTVNADGTWSFTPDPAFNAMQAGNSLTTSVQITVVDSRNSSAESTLSVTVNGENDAPEQIALSGNTVALDSDDLTIGRLQADDPDTGDLHSFSLVELDGKAGDNAFFRINGNTLELVDTAIGTGTATVYIQARDTNGLTHIQTFEIRVTDTAILKITGDSDSTGNAVNGQHAGLIKEGAAANTEVGIRVEATHALDAEATITFSLLDDAAGRFQIDSGSGVVTVASNATFDITLNRTHTIVVQALASDGLLVTASFVIGVVPDVLTVANDSAEASEDATQPITGNVVDNDPANDHLGGPLTVTAVNGEASGLGQAISGDNGGTFTINADGSWQFDPNGEFERLDEGESQATSVTLTISNALGMTETSVLSVTVTGRADAPTTLALDAISFDVKQTPPIVGILSGTDVDSDQSDLVFTLPQRAENPHNELFDTAGNQLRVKNGVSLEVGTVYSLYIEVSDGTGSKGRTLEITATDPDVPLIIGDSDVRGDDSEKGVQGSIKENHFGTAQEVGIDVDSIFDGEVIYSIYRTDSAGQEHHLFSIDSSTGVISVKAGATLNAETAARHSVLVKATDSENPSNSAERVFSIEVRNIPPWVNDDTYTISTQTTILSGNIHVNDADVAGSGRGDLQILQVNGDQFVAPGRMYAGSDGGEFYLLGTGDWSFYPRGDFGALTPGQSITTTLSILIQEVGLSNNDAFVPSDPVESILSVTVVAPDAVGLDQNKLDLAQLGNAVGTLSATGDAIGPFAFELVSGAGDDGNEHFSISGDVLNVVREPLPEPGEYSIRVKVTDGRGQENETLFTVTLLNTDLDFTLRDVDVIADNRGINPTGYGVVREGAANGSTVGVTFQTDQPRDSITFELIDDADGRFTIDGNGVVRVADTSQINAEDGDLAFGITVRATEAGTGKTAEKTHQIFIDNMPITAVDDRAEVDENTAAPVVGNVFSNDLDPNSELPGDDAVVLAAGPQLLSVAQETNLTIYDVMDKMGSGLNQEIRGSNGGIFHISASGDWRFDPSGDFEYLARGEEAPTELIVLVSDQGMMWGEDSVVADDIPDFVNGKPGDPQISKIRVLVQGENDAPVVVGESDPAFTITAKVGESLNYAFDTSKITDADTNHTHENRAYRLINPQSIPDGLTVYALPPRVEGIPAEAGTFVFQMRATDPDAASVEFSIRVEVAAADATPEPPIVTLPVTEPPQDNTLPRDNVTPPSQDDILPQRPDNAQQPVLRDNLNLPGQRPSGLGSVAGDPSVNNLFSDNTASLPGDPPQLPELNLTFGGNGFEGAGDTGPDQASRNEPQIPAQTPARVSDTTIPFDPAPFGPTAAGGERDNGSPRGVERVLLPDGQFIEPLPRSASLNDYVLDIGLNLENQLGLVDTRFSYEVPAAAFVFRSGGEMFVGEVSYRAVQVDGSPLPAWLGFNNRDALFTGVPGDADTETLQIRVIAESADGQQASAVFEIRVNEQPVQRAEGATDSNNDQAAAEDAAPHAHDTEQVAGKAGLSEQLAHHAELEITAAEQQLLQQLAQFNFDQTPAS